MEAGRGGRSRRREAKGGAYEEIAKLWQAKGTFCSSSGRDPRKAHLLSTADLAPTCVAAYFTYLHCLSTLLLSPVGVRAAPLDVRLRVLRVVPLVPLRALIPEDRRVRFIRRACVGCRQTVQVLPTFRASSRRRATELSFRGAVMVFLVFLEVLEIRARPPSGLRRRTSRRSGPPRPSRRCAASPQRAAGRCRCCTHRSVPSAGARTGGSTSSGPSSW